MSLSYTYFKFSNTAGKKHFYQKQCNQTKKIMVKFLSHKQSIAIIRFECMVVVDINGPFLHALSETLNFCT